MVISVANTKGGCGRSSVTIFLAAALAAENKDVLIIDCDSQETIKAISDIQGNEAIKVEALPARFVQQYLQMNASKYDVIFIDVARFTKAEKDDANTMLLYYCDAILIPSNGSIVDVLSTIDFLEVIHELQQFKLKNDFDFHVHGFINRFSNRSENMTAINTLQQKGLSMFVNNLKDLKIFASPSFQSLLNTKEGMKRFNDFYLEFKEKFNIDG